MPQSAKLNTCKHQKSGKLRAKRPKKPIKWTVVTILSKGISVISRGFSFINSI